MPLGYLSSGHADPGLLAFNPGGYFVAGYFDPALVAASGVPNLFAAIVLRLRAYPGLADAFQHTTAAPKFWADLAPAGVDLPFLTYTEVSGHPGDYSSDGSYIETGTFQIGVCCAGKRQSRDLARYIGRALDDAAPTFQDGLLMYLRKTNMFSQVVGDEGPAIVAEYQRIIEFRYMVHRTRTS